MQGAAHRGKGSGVYVAGAGRRSGLAERVRGEQCAGSRSSSRRARRPLSMLSSDSVPFWRKMLSDIMLHSALSPVFHCRETAAHGEGLAQAVAGGAHV